MNIVPLRVVAEGNSPDLLHIQVDVVGVTEERLTLIAAKIGQVTSVFEASWHRR